MKINTTIILFFVILLTACSSINVVNVKEVTEMKDYGLVYALPKNVIIVEAEATSVVKIKGPFSEYAEKYLGITEVITANSTNWQLSDIRYSTKAVADPDHFYLIQTSGKFITDNISISPEGILLSVNKYLNFDPKEEIIVTSLDQIEEEQTIFKDVTVKNNFKEVKKTTYREIRTDSTYKKMPVYNTSSEPKSIEEKAEEAANYILKLRKRRFKMLAGMSDTKLPDGKAVNIMLENLKKSEEDYLSLFIGRTYSEKQHVTCRFEPEPSEETNNIVLFRFSDDEGILKPDANEGSPVSIEVSKSGSTDQIKNMLEKQLELKEVDKGIVYRTPELAKVDILKDSTTLATTRFLLSQYGNINVIPAKLILDGASFEFYPEFGSIKNIYNKKK